MLPDHTYIVQIKIRSAKMSQNKVADGIRPLNREGIAVVGL